MGVEKFEIYLLISIQVEFGALGHYGFKWKQQIENLQHTPGTRAKLLAHPFPNFYMDVKKCEIWHQFSTQVAIGLKGNNVTEIWN